MQRLPDRLALGQRDNHACVGLRLCAHMLTSPTKACPQVATHIKETTSFVGLEAEFPE